MALCCNSENQCSLAAAAISNRMTLAGGLAAAGAAATPLAAAAAAWPACESGAKQSSEKQYHDGCRRANRKWRRNA